MPGSWPADGSFATSHNHGAPPEALRPAWSPSLSPCGQVRWSTWGAADGVQAYGPGVSHTGGARV